METKQLTQDEVQQLKLLQQKNQAIVTEFGQIELLKLDIESRVQDVKAFLEEVREEEKALGQFLETTYGKGSIDMDKGEFTPFE
jgi:hypothetical protein